MLNMEHFNIYNKNETQLFRRKFCIIGIIIFPHFIPYEYFVCVSKLIDLLDRSG